MCILNKISVLLREKKKTQKELCNHLGLKQQAFTNWKSGNNDSYKKYLPQIADYFGVSVGYLLGEEEKEKEPIVEDEFSESRKKLIDFASSVPEDKVDLILRVMQSIAEGN